MFTIGVSAGIDADEFRGLLEFLESCESKGRARAFPFEPERCLTGVIGPCSGGGETRSDNSPANIPLRDLPHPFEVLPNSNRGGIGLFCAKARLMSTSLTLILRRLVCFDKGATSLKSLAIGVIVGEAPLPGIVTTTIELLSDSWLSLKGSSSGRMLGRGFERLELGSGGIPTSPNTSETVAGSSLLGNGGTGGGKVSEKMADADETGVGNEPLIVRLIADVRNPKMLPNKHTSHIPIDHGRWSVPTSCPGTHWSLPVRKSSRPKLNVRHELLNLVVERGKRAFGTEGEGAGLVDGLGSTQSGLRVLRKFDEPSPRW